MQLVDSPPVRTVHPSLLCGPLLYKTYIASPPQINEFACKKARAEGFLSQCLDWNTPRPKVAWHSHKRWPMRVCALGFLQIASHARAALDSNSTPTGHLGQRRAVSFHRSYASLPTFMQVLWPSPPTIIATCVHSAEGATRSAPCSTACAHGSELTTMLRCSFALAIWPMPLQEKPLDSVDYLLYTNIFPATEDEYGIASNAVTVLKPDLVEVCCATDTELAITFPPKGR
jgi:hypothetical protein